MPVESFLMNMLKISMYSECYINKNEAFDLRDKEYLSLFGF